MMRFNKTKNFLGHGVLLSLGLVGGLVVPWFWAGGLGWADKLPTTPLARPAASANLGEAASGANRSAYQPQSEAAAVLLRHAHEDFAAVQVRLAAAMDQYFQSYAMGGNASADELMFLIKKLVKLNPEAAVAHARAMNPGSFFYKLALNEWFHSQKTEALAWMKQHEPRLWKQALEDEQNGSGDTNLSAPWFRKGISGLAKRDPVAGEAALRRRGMNREEGLTALLNARDHEEPAETLAWAKKLPLPEDGEAIYRSLFSKWGTQDPHAAAAAWMGLTNNAGKEAALKGLVKSWAKTSLPDTLEWLRSQPQSAKIQQALASVLLDAPAGTLAETLPLLKDPVALNSLASSQLGGNLSPDQFWAKFSEWQTNGATQVPQDALQKLVTADRSAALRAYQNLPDGPAKNSAAGWLADKFVELNPAEALPVARALPAGLLRDAMLKALAGSSEISVNDVLPLLNQTTNSDPAAKLIKRTVETDPAAAVGLFQGMPQSQQAKILQGTFADSDRDYSKTSAFLTQLPPDLQLPEYFQSVATGWVVRAPEAASEWINQLPPGVNRDHAVRGMVANLMTIEWDPQAALTWSATVADPAIRALLIDRTVAAWNQRSPDQARQAITNSILSDAEKSALLTP